MLKTHTLWRMWIGSVIMLVLQFLAVVESTILFELVFRATYFHEMTAIYMSRWRGWNFAIQLTSCWILLSSIDGKVRLSIDILARSLASYASWDLNKWYLKISSLLTNDILGYQRKTDCGNSKFWDPLGTLGTSKLYISL